MIEPGTGPLSDEILRVWKNTGASYARAADEIVASRHEITQLKEALKKGSELIASRLAGASALVKVIDLIREELEMSLDYCPVTQGGPDIEPAMIEQLIEKIDKVMKGPASSD